MNKRHIFMVVLMTVLVASPLVVFAAKKATTAEEAAKMEKGTMAHLVGYIDEKLTTGMYLFRDDTGKIDLDIPDDVWKDRKLDPKEKLVIHGEIETDDGGKNYVKVSKMRLTFKEKVKDVF